MHILSSKLFLFLWIISINCMEIVQVRQKQISARPEEKQRLLHEGLRQVGGNVDVLSLEGYHGALGGFAALRMGQQPLVARP